MKPFFAIAALAAASFLPPTAHALAVGDVLNMPPDAQAAYIIGVMDGWAIDPRNLDCQEALSNRQLASATVRFLNSVKAESPESATGRMRVVPAALALHLELGRVCAEALKKP